MKDPCSKEELYFTAHRAPKTSLDLGKEATMHSWAVQSAQPCLEQSVGRGLRLTASEVPRRSPKHEQIVAWGLQRTKSFTGHVGLHLGFFFLPSVSQTKLASPTVLFQEEKQHQVPALQKQQGGQALLSQEGCSAGMLCPRRGTEPPCAPQAGSTQVDAIKKDTLP